MKAKLKFVIEVEYIIEPENYPEGMTAEQMLQLDIDASKDDPMSSIPDGADWVITGELINV